MKTETIIETLRRAGTPLCKVAADEIERLQAELKRIKSAAGHPKDDGAGG